MMSQPTCNEIKLSLAQHINIHSDVAVGKCLVIETSVQTESAAHIVTGSCAILQMQLLH
jgi:hypothetical protein